MVLFLELDLLLYTVICFEAWGADYAVVDAVHRLSFARSYHHCVLHSVANSEYCSHAMMVVGCFDSHPMMMVVDSGYRHLNVPDDAADH